MGNRADRLTAALRARIGRGIFPVGSKLPSEQAIALKFQVSRTVVREAVIRLKAEGLVETRKGAAARVRAAGAGTDEGVILPRSIDGLLGFLEVRRPIEGEMAALAAERRTEAQCAEIAAALGAIEEATATSRSGVDEDLAFHLAIGRATSNAYWSQFISVFVGPMRAAIRLTRANEARDRDFAIAVAQEHFDIYRAIVDQDADRARAAALQHVENAATRILFADPGFWHAEGLTLARNWEETVSSEPLSDEL